MARKIRLAEDRAIWLIPLLAGLVVLDLLQERRHGTRLATAGSTARIRAEGAGVSGGDEMRTPNLRWFLETGRL